MAPRPYAKCSDYMAKEGYDLSGAQIDKPGTWDVYVQHVGDCCDKCDTVPECEGFVFWEAGSRCYLVSNIFEDMYPHSGRTAYRKKATPAPTPPVACPHYLAPKVGSDLAGLPLSNATDGVPVQSPSHCCTLCNKYSSCQGFVYLVEGRWCYLKQRTRGVYRNSGRIAYLKSGVNFR